MQNKTEKLPEIVFTSSNAAEARRLSRLKNSGDLIKIAPKIYTGNIHKSPEILIRENWRMIVAHFYPGAVVSHRTAFMGGQIVDNTVFITTQITKTVLLSGLTIRALKGASATEHDMPLPEDDLYMSSEARYLMENLQLSRAVKTISKSVGIEKVECYIEKIIRNRGEIAINKIRDQAKKISGILGFESEFKILNKIIGALLTTQSGHVLLSGVARSRAAGEPYDPDRLKLFETLFLYLRESSVKNISSNMPQNISRNAARAHDNEIWRNAAFFDAYFSNYIEGTDFLIDEAKSIIFDDQIIKGRISDSHDVLETYKVLNNHIEMLKTPHSANEFIELLKHRHHVIMGYRDEIKPGQFKDVSNRAGNTEFVDPELVVGTLKKGFNFYNQLDVGFQKAAFIMFMTVEVHPFIDGNGRLARVFMNAEMMSAKQTRIIIPTVFREDYLLTLRRLTRESDAGPYVKMLTRAQQFSESIDFSSLKTAEQQLESCNAFKSPMEAKLRVFV